MARRVAQHRIFDLAATLLLIAVVTTLRSSLLPHSDEAIANVATPLGQWLQFTEDRIPILSVIIWALSLVIAGLNVGRYGIRLSLYPAYTLMAIPVFGVVAAAIMCSNDYLLTTVTVTIMLLATKYIMRCIMRSGSYGDLSLSMLYFGLLPLIYAPTAIFYVALPIITLVARSSWRDWVVTLSSLALPIAAVCYWSWCAGEEFLKPAQEVYTAFLTQSEFHFFSIINPATIILLGILIVMILCSISLIFSDKYSLKVKSRVVMRFNTLMFTLLIGLFFAPSASATLFALLAVPTAILVPLMFVRMGVGFTETLYRLMLLAAAANTLLMCW
ncbi:MAG: hypothetical protein IKA01_09320 [Alistipes sp.]|nr:hypothetical protein [Alistipes sp.]